MGIVRQLQLAINSILSKDGNKQLRFPKTIMNTREMDKEVNNIIPEDYPGLR